MVEAQQPIACINDHADRVETYRAGIRPPVSLVVQPRHRQSPHAGALAGTEPGQRLLIWAHALSYGAHTASLYLGEHKTVSVERDQVDLAVTGAHVARQYREAKPGEVSSSEILSQAAERAPRIGLMAGGRRAMWPFSGAVKAHGLVR